MRICLFGDARSPHIQRLCPGLAFLGNEVHVVCHHPVPVPGATVERFRVPAAGITNLRRWNGRFRKYVRDFLRDFDVVSVQFLHDWGFTPEMADEGCMTLTAWGSDIVPPMGEAPPSDELRLLRIELLRHAHRVTVCGRHFSAVVADFADMPMDDIVVVPFGVDVEVFCPTYRSADETAPADRGDDAPSPAVGFFKGFRPVYGPDILLQALPDILRRQPDVRFEFVGDGPMRCECQNMAQRLGVADSVTWLDAVPNRHVPDLLRRWKLSVIPSRFEAFGVAALESSAMGIPVVASDVCGLRDTVVDGVTGTLVPPEEPTALADAVSTLLQAENSRAAMGEAGRKFVEDKFDIATVSKTWHDTFASALDAGAVMV